MRDVARSGVAAVRGWVAASTLDAAADTLFLVGLGWSAAFAAGDLSAAAILAVGTIPRAVMMLVGGAAADRWGLAITANVTLVVRAVLMALFALILASSGGPNGYLLAAVSLLFGIVDGLHVPALSGLVGVVAPGDAMRSAQAMATAGALVAQVIAAPVAGFLVASRGGAVGWVGFALLMVAGAVMIELRRHLPHSTARAAGEADGADSAGDDESMVAAIRGGLRYALGSWSVSSLLLVFLLTNLAATAPVAVGIPLQALKESWPGELYGVATLGFALGSALGIFLMERRSPEAGRTLGTGLRLIAAGSIGSVVLAVATNPLLACAGCFVMGVLFAPAAVLLRTELFRATPETHLGRVGGLLGFAIYGGIPVGFALYGWLVSMLSITAAGLIMTGALLAVLTVVSLTGSARSRVDAQA